MPSPRRSLLLGFAFVALLMPNAKAVDPGWIELIGKDSFDAFKGGSNGWVYAKDVKIDPKNPRRLAYESGHDAIVNGPIGRTINLVTKEEFGDVEVHLEFLVPTKSNSGIKLHAVYEVQIYDSHGVARPTASDNGGVYPRAELLPKYHHIDKGYPPLRNASKSPGEWQTLDIAFKSPRFDASGKKVANATFVKVLLNGQVVQENLELPYPTGHNWRNKETPRGPIFLQADHGPVAFRNFKVRPLKVETGAAK